MQIRSSGWLFILLMIFRVSWTCSCTCRVDDGCWGEKWMGKAGEEESCECCGCLGVLCGVEVKVRAGLICM